MVECATDNPQRTVANVRAIFKGHGGSFGQTGSVGFMFKPMGVFRITPGGFDAEELELALIDHGLEDMGESTGESGDAQIVARCGFSDFGRLQAEIERRELPLISAESEQVAETLVTLTEEQAKEVLEMVDALEQDDDVDKVFHNLA